MVFAPKRTVTTLPAANSVPASALWEMAVTLPVLPPVLVAPVAFLAGRFIAPLDNRAQLRPLVYIASIAVVCLAEHLAVSYTHLTLPTT